MSLMMKQLHENLVYGLTLLAPIFTLFVGWFRLSLGSDRGSRTQALCTELLAGQAVCQDLGKYEV